MSDRFDCIISADSHVIEPYEIYTGGLHNKFGDQSPRMLEEYAGKPYVKFHPLALAQIPPLTNGCSIVPSIFRCR